MTPRPRRERPPVYVWCFLAGLVLDIFSGYSQYVGLPVSGDRILLPLAVALLLLDPRTERPRWNSTYLFGGLLTALAAFSALGHRTLIDPVGGFALLDRIVMPVVLFATAPLAFQTAQRRDLLLKTLTLLGIYLGLTGIFEIVGPHALVWPRYILNTSLGIHVGRARGPFLVSETMGMSLALCLFAAAFLLTRVARTSLWRVAAAACVVATAGGIVANLTRSVWAGLALGLVAVAALHRPLRRPVAGLVMAGAAGLGLLLATTPGLGDTLQDRLSAQAPLYDRQNVNDAALRAIEARPLTGVGWARFAGPNNPWVRQADTYPLTKTNLEIHNVFLSRAAELGLPAAACFALALLVGPVRMALVRGRDDLHGWQLMTVAGLCVLAPPLLLSPNSSPLPNYLIWLFAGIAGRPVLVHGADAELVRDALPAWLGGRTPNAPAAARAVEVSS